MNRLHLRAALATAAAAGVLLAATATAAVEEGETRFFLRADGCGATAEPGRLSTVSGAPDGDSADGCGFIGGPPLDEVFFQVDGAPLNVYDFTTENGVPLTLDAARDLSGVIATQSWTGTGGAGQVVVELSVFGTRLDAAGKPRSVQIGSGTFETTALPTATVYEVPFTLDVPDALAGVELTSLSMSVGVHGVNWNAQAQKYSGSSFVDVPTLVEASPDGAEPTAVEG